MARLLAFVAVFVLMSSETFAAEPLRIACVGDSITFGAGVEKREENNYPLVLGKLLGDGYKTANFGVSGATMLKKGDLPYWKQPAFKKASEFAPNIVVIKLGTNDTKPQNWKFKDEYASDLAAMAEHFAALPTKPKIFVCLPVPVYATQWGINEAALTEGVIPAIKKVAKDKNLTTIDLYKALSGKPEMFPDKIHPNAAGAKVIAETVAASVKQ